MARPCLRVMLGVLAVSLSAVISASAGSENATTAPSGPAARVAEAAPAATAVSCASAVTVQPPGAGLAGTIQLGRSVGDLAVSQRTGHLFVPTYTDYGQSVARCQEIVYMLDARSGRLLHQLLMSDLPRLPTVEEATNRLFLDAFTFLATSPHDALLMIDARSGRVLRRIALKGTPQRTHPVEATRRLLAESYLGGGCPPCSGLLTVLDGTKGRILSTEPEQAGVAVFAVDEAHKRVYLTEKTMLTALDAGTGRRLWRRSIRPCGWGISVVPWSRRLFTTLGGTTTIGGQGAPGRFCVIDPSTGRVLSAMDLGQGIFLNVLLVDAGVRAVFATEAGPLGSGALELLDPWDGHVTRVLRGVHGAALAALPDPQTGRIFLLSQPRGGSAWVQWVHPPDWQVHTLSPGLPASGPDRPIMALAVRARRIFVGTPGSRTISVVCMDKRC